MTDVAVDTLRLRGPGAQRLARVAATTLPSALEAACAGLPDAELSRLGIRLELDVEGYDDETLAVLWADALGTALRAALRDAPRPPPQPSRTPPAAAVSADMPPQPPTGPAAVAEAARAWLADDPGSPAIPAMIFALAGPGVADGVRRILTDGPWRDLVDQLAERLGPAREPTSATPAAGASGPGDAPETDPGETATEPPRPAGTVHPADSHPVPGTTPDAVPPEPPATPRLPARLAALAVLAASDGPSLSDPLPTRAAGIVLLYPWLADLCRAAEALHPWLAASAVRAAALAAVVDPANPAVAADPLIALLAGHHPGPGAPDPRHARLPHADELAASADAILSGFATLLPGFTRSSPAYVRDQWILRDGLLDTGRDPVRLTAATRPLDVALQHLPYPVGLLRLPWSPTLTVLFR